jgi:hypothetical protein
MSCPRSAHSPRRRSTRKVKTCSATSLGRSPQEPTVPAPAGCSARPRGSRCRPPQSSYGSGFNNKQPPRGSSVERTMTAHFRSARAADGTNTLVRCPHSGHSYAISPGSPASGAMLTTSFISVPHLAHRGAVSSLHVLSSVILDTRPFRQSCSAVFSPLRANASCVAWFGAVARTCAMKLGPSGVSALPASMLMSYRCHRHP